MATATGHNGSHDRKSKTLKLSPFVGSKDELDSYLQRPQRYDRISGWSESERASYLSALLTGKALDVYSRLADSVAENYSLLK